MLEQKKSVEKMIIGTGNLKKFYAYINSKLKDRPKISVLKDVNGKATNNTAEMVEILNNRFRESFSTDNLSVKFEAKSADKSILVKSMSSLNFPPANIANILNK